MPKASAVAIRTVVVGLKLLELGTAGQKPGAETEQGGDYAVPDSVDCASELEPIVEVAKFKSEVEQAVSQVLMPRHDGIRIEKITSPAAAGAGYLIMQVERSDRRPHRNEAGEKQPDGRAQGGVTVRRFDNGPCAYAAIDPAEIFSGRGDRISEREELDLDCAECSNARCGIFWAANSGRGATSSRP